MILSNTLIQGWRSGMALRVLAVLVEDQLLVPSTHTV